MRQRGRTNHIPQPYIDRSSMHPPPYLRTTCEPTTALGFPREDIPTAPSVSSETSAHSRRYIRGGTPPSRLAKWLPSSQEQERDLLTNESKLGRLLEDCEDALGKPLETVEDFGKLQEDSDEELWKVHDHESLDDFPEIEDPPEGLVREAEVLHSSIWQQGVLSRAEERKREEKRKRQAVLNVIKARKKRRSPSFASNSSSPATPPLVPPTSSPGRRIAHTSTPPTSVSHPPPSADWAKTIFSPSPEMARAVVHCEGASAVREESKSRDGSHDSWYQKDFNDDENGPIGLAIGDEVTGEYQLDWDAPKIAQDVVAEDEDEEEIPWSSSPIRGHGVLVPASEDGQAPEIEPQQAIIESGEAVSKAGKGKGKEVTLEPEIVNLVSDDDEPLSFDEGEDFSYGPSEYYPPPSQLSKLPPAPAIPIYDVPDSPEPERPTYSMTFLQDLNKADREFFENHYQRSAVKRTAGGETGHEKQARNMALGIGTAKEANIKKRAAAAKKPWGRSAWRGRGRGRGRGKT